ncbi:MAG: hypothetical protein V3V08_07720 [Nannocystaceae bacterium]
MSISAKESGDKPAVQNPLEALVAPCDTGAVFDLFATLETRARVSMAWRRKRSHG